MPQVIVADADRIRRLNADNYSISLIQGIQSYRRVYTIAGQHHQGEEDGIGPEASFRAPRVRSISRTQLPLFCGFVFCWYLSILLPFQNFSDARSNVQLALGCVHGG